VDQRLGWWGEPGLGFDGVEGSIAIDFLLRHWRLLILADTEELAPGIS